MKEKFYDWLRNLPSVYRWVVSILLAAAACIYLLTSCGTVARTVITTAGGDNVKVTSSISKRDSTGLDISVNPTINLHR